MKPMLKFIIVLCLVSFVLSISIPQEETEDSAGDDAEEEGGADDAEGSDEADGADDAEEKDDKEENSGDKTDEEGNGEGKKESEGDSPKGGDEEDDRVNTYNKVSEIVKKATNSDKIKDEYFRSYLDGSLQSALRNPLIGAVGEIGQFSKIEECFKSLEKDVEKIVTEKNKAFADCKGKPDASEYNCSTEQSQAAETELGSIASKIVSCVSSKGA
ncbi:30 kDa salivary gland allergen Aed a 3-like [Wyeomyia smithii]|uniref:30 kDa salivary gland allergen Aed a 3-like n=1 Tax=Wyeomyia smithii TaxID=174621 RepID=UPI002467F0BF|nr:30 kDa salivary gland allergen Aed a 3-like [Wyeomyia smithii]